MRTVLVDEAIPSLLSGEGVGSQPRLKAYGHEVPNVIDVHASDPQTGRADGEVLHTFGLFAPPCYPLSVIVVSCLGHRDYAGSTASTVT